MKIFSRSATPAWEIRDPGKRSAAVASADSASIAARLPELARNDADAGVRSAAVRRLDDLALLSDRMRNDADAGVRQVARARLEQLFGDPAPATAERERVLRVEDDADLLAWVAANARLPALRRLALERSARPAFIAERCMRDPDLEVRLWLLERIEALPALQRIADATRTSDKQLARRARERVHLLKLEQGDPATLRERALAMCGELDALRRNRPADTTARAEALRQEWERLRARVPPELAPRVEGYFAALLAAERPLRAPEPSTDAPADDAVSGSDATAAGAAPELEAESAPEPGTEAHSASPSDVEAVPIAPAATTEASDPVGDGDPWRTAEQAASGAESTQTAGPEVVTRPPPSREALERHLAEARQALEAGHLALARSALHALRAERAGHRGLPARLAQGIAECEQDVAKLAQWQHWSNNRIRARLCEEMAALPASGLHPDAVAAKVKEAQVEWLRLADSERDTDADGRPEGGIAQRFRALCHRALAPTRPYFEKRREVRAERLTAHAALLEEAALCGEDTGPGALAAVRRRVGEALRRLDELDPKVRGETGRRLRQAMARFDDLREGRARRLAAAEAERHGTAEAAKRKLLANLRRELQRVSLADGLARATAAREQWARLGMAAAPVEAELERALHGLIDPWFEKSRAEDAAQLAAREARAAEERGILAELDELANAGAEGLRQADARLLALNARWRALFAPEPEAAAPARPHGGFERERRQERRPRKAEPTRAERDFDRGVARVREAQQRAAKTRELAALESARLVARRCEEIELAAMRGTSPSADDPLAAGWDALSLPQEALEPLQKRHASAIAALAGGTPYDAGLLSRNEAAAAALAVRAEALAGLETPEPYKALRRQLQVQRLAQRMGGGVLPEANEEARGLRLQWLLLGPLEAEARAALAPRIDAAFAQLARN